MQAAAVSFRKGETAPKDYPVYLVKEETDEQKIPATIQSQHTHFAIGAMILVRGAARSLHFTCAT